MKMKMHVALLMLLVSPILTSSCATIVHGSSQEISINSEPQGASVYIDGKERGKTPLSMLLSRKTKTYVVDIKKKCYYPKTVEINRALSATVAGNLVAGGIIGGGIDAASGAAYKLVPDKINVLLKPLPNCSLSKKIQANPKAEKK